MIYALIETLKRQVTGLGDVNCRPSPRPVFSKREEERLSNYCIQMANMGFRLSKEDVILHSKTHYSNPICQYYIKEYHWHKTLAYTCTLTYTHDK